jgi:hypothetical protein
MHVRYIHVYTCTFISTLESSSRQQDLTFGERERVLQFSSRVTYAGLDPPLCSWGGARQTSAVQAYTVYAVFSQLSERPGQHRHRPVYYTRRILGLAEDTSHIPYRILYKGLGGLGTRCLCSGLSCLPCMFTRLCVSVHAGTQRSDGAAGRMLQYSRTCSRFRPGM